MYYEEFGDKKNRTIIFLHGALFVDTFKKQYILEKQFHLVIPHLIGFGKEADRIYSVDQIILELHEIILKLDKKVMMIGFSIGAQLAFEFVNTHPELISKAIFISPWLIKEQEYLALATGENLNILRKLKHKGFCYFVGLMNGLSRIQRKEFSHSIQRINEESIINMVKESIELKDFHKFGLVTIPMIAIAGKKEDQEMHQSVIELSKMNSNCQSIIWEKAGHNIPISYDKRLNQLILDFANKA